MSSRGLRSAATAKKTATRPAATIRPAPMQNARTASATTPLSVSSAKSRGPKMPPAAAPMA
ncbi:hypothetical protein RKD22_000623 [Streptomyces pristinaespiralis]